MGKTIEFHMGGNMELKAVSIFLRVKENYQILGYISLYAEQYAIIKNGNCVFLMWDDVQNGL